MVPGLLKDSKVACPMGAYRLAGRGLEKCHRSLSTWRSP